MAEVIGLRRGNEPSEHERYALIVARLHIPDQRPERDALIAATALVHGRTVVTRNVSDFAPMGMTLFNPWIAPDARV